MRYEIRELRWRCFGFRCCCCCCCGHWSTFWITAHISTFTTAQNRNVSKWHRKKITTLGILIRKDYFIYPMKPLNAWFNNRFNKSSLLMQCNKNVFPVLMAQWIREFWSNEEKHNHSVLWCKKYHLISFPLFICRLNCIHLFRFRGTSGIDIALDKVDIDQCPQPDNAKEPNVFAGSARCKPETTKVTVVNKRQN